LGQILVIGLPGPEIDAVSRDLLVSICPGGVILFARNLLEPAQIAALTRDIRRLVKPPPFVAVDQEGGRVSRLTPPFPRLPAPADLGRLDMVGVSRWFGALTGRGLRSLGFQVDYAPVVDLSSPEADDGIGDRAFSADAGEASRRAAAFLQGLADARIEGCLKHFPGLGGAPADTHDILPRIVTGPERRRHALTPYRRLRDQASQVMVAHAHYPEVSGPEPLPASLDRRVVSELLRREIGFPGLIVSDDLEMGAVVDRAPFGDVALAAVQAGNDQILICHRPDRVSMAWDTIREGLRSGDLDTDVVEASLARIAAFKARPACRHAEERYEPEELRLVVDEMNELTGQVDLALRRQRPRA
jgi:beta-N-acetylhexosaminidase